MRDQHPSAAVLRGEIEQLRKENIVLSQGYSSYVSRHRMAEEALSASESRYRRLFETAKDGILILDAKSGMIIDVNPFLINLLGYSKQQFTEKAIWEIGFLKDIVANKEKFIELQEREYVRYENLPLKTSEGYEINVEFVSNVYQVNSISVIQCNIRDITERKRAEKRMRDDALTRIQKEEALSKSEALYRDLVEKSNDGVYKSTHDGRFVEVNTAMVNILGYTTKAELMEVSIASLQYFDPDDQQSQPLNELPEGIGSYRLHKKDGSTIWVEDHISYDLDDAGNIQYHRGIIRDVTERIMAQEKIKELNETLEMRIAQRTAQLESTNKKLEFHNQEIEQYSYIINHDLQEPLRTLIQFTSILLNDYARIMDEDGKKYLDFIHNSALRMKELVMDLREYSGLGKTGEKTTIDCNIIVTHVLNDLGDAIHGSNALINVERLPVLIGFETEIRLLFQNLINNAIKFHKKEKRPVIGISAKSHAEEWIFKVSDNGIGIDPKYKDRIFTIFQRLHKRTDYEGTGIGLAHCKKIVELHGGVICVDSTIGAGSIFTFTIPKHPA